MIKITPADLHPHLQARMNQRGVTLSEIEQTLNNGWQAKDIKPGTLGKVMVFNFEDHWEGQWYLEKEVSIYYKISKHRIILLTVKARYGKDFVREPME